MASVEKINIANTKTNKYYTHHLSSFGNSTEARKAYLDMNKAVYVDYVDGDISLPGLIAQKLKNFWNIMRYEDPTIEIKARIIEKSLHEGANEEQIKQYFNMVA